MSREHGRTARKTLVQASVLAQSLPEFPTDEEANAIIHSIALLVAMGIRSHLAYTSSETGVTLSGTDLETTVDHLSRVCPHLEIAAELKRQLQPDGVIPRLQQLVQAGQGPSDQRATPRRGPSLNNLELISRGKVEAPPVPWSTTKANLKQLLADIDAWFVSDIEKLENS